MGQKQTKPFVYKTYNDIWQYDPEKDTWTQKSDFPGPGRLMAKGFSVNNRIYVGFGYVIAASGPSAGSNDYQTDLYEYNPSSNSWAKKNDALLGRGDIFFVSNNIMRSVNPEFRSINKYNAQTDTWFESKWEKAGIAPGYTDMEDGRINFSSMDREYFITTTWKKNKVTNELWELDPNNMTWRRKNDLPGKGSDTIQVFTANEKHFAIRGGREILQYNADSDAWVAKKEVPYQHKDFYACFSIGDKIYGFSKFEFWEFTP